MKLDAAPPARFATAFDELHEVVGAKVGSDDFGTSDYRLGLQVLLQSLDYDPRLTEAGRALVWNQLVSALAGRAVAFRSFREYPAHAQNAIDRPVVIIGVPRTGTTALHKLMAVDPQFQGLEKWLLGAPMPRPPRDTWEAEPMFQKEVDELNERYGIAPDQRAGHNMVAEEVDECLWVQRQTFVSNFWTCNWSAATYDAWWQGQDERASYDYLRRSIQLIGLNDPGKRWLLKNPGHVLHLDLLFAIFPDALVVQTHRDPAKAVPSLCQFLIQSHPTIEHGRLEQRAHNMGRREVAKWAHGVRTAEPTRQAYADQILDVVHTDFHAAPMETIRRIYAFADLELTPKTEAAMADRIAAAPELAHGVHRYRIEDFGLSVGEVHEQFGDYIDRFGLRERRAA